MAAFLRDFGEPGLLGKYETRLRTAIVDLEQQVEKLPTEKQGEIIAALTDHLLAGLIRAQEQAKQEILHSPERSR